MIAVISVTKKGDVLGDIILENLHGVLFKKSEESSASLDEITKNAFNNYKYIVFISSTGIAVRAIANYLKGKSVDPGVIVVDVCNNFTISLVSGHLGGANRLTNTIAKILKNTPVITTATDNMNIEAPDIIAINNRLIIKDLKMAKVLASNLVNGKEVYFKDDRKLISCPSGYSETEVLKENTLWITNKDIDHEGVLKLIRKDIVLGIGCKRNTDSCKLFEFIKGELKKLNISLQAIKYIGSIDIKSKEKAVLDLAKSLNCHLRFFNKDEIIKVEDKYEGSNFVKEKVGVKAVSEPVVELLCGKFIVQKIKKDGMTLSVGYLS